jgi:hypothetical protein
MNTKSLIAALAVLGSSSLALADVYGAQNGSFHQIQTVQSSDPCETPAPVVVKHPIVKPIYNPNPLPPVYQGPITIGSESRIWRGTETFHVGAWKGKFQTLKLESSGLKSFIGSVQIRFANGQTQNVTLNRYVDSRNPCLTVDLLGRDARAVQSVTLTGANARSSTLSIILA